MGGQGPGGEGLPCPAQPSAGRAGDSGESGLCHLQLLQPPLIQILEASIPCFPSFIHSWVQFI